MSSYWPRWLAPAPPLPQRWRLPPQPTSTAVVTEIVTETATEIPAETKIAVAVTGSGIIGGDPEFNPAALVWQGYWLSRDQFGPLVMASGMGIPFEPPMEMMAQNADDPLTAPLNMLPLQAMFASGSPDMINDPRDFDPLDMEGLIRVSEELLLSTYLPT